MKTIIAILYSFIVGVAPFLLPTGDATAADWDKPVVFEPIDVTGINGAAVNPSDLKPGLSSWYYLEFFERDLRELPKSKRTEHPTFGGKPILQLNHQFEKNDVFESGTNRGVGMRMKGFIHFVEPGHYEMQALSNDGVIVYLSGQLAINDPEQHADRLSNLARFKITDPGWYQVVVEYFQRKGTAALKLLWKKPGSVEFVAIPKSAYAHLPDAR